MPVSYSDITRNKIPKKNAKWKPGLKMTVQKQIIKWPGLTNILPLISFQPPWKHKWYQVSFKNYKAYPD